MYPYSEIAKNMIEVENEAASLKMIKNREFFYITEKSFYSYVSANDCELVIAKEEFFSTDYGWAFPKGTPYIQKFNDR